MDSLIKHIAKIIRPRCISDASATLAAIDVVTWINDGRNKCECPNEIKTGSITENLCNICGRPENNSKKQSETSKCPICGAEMWNGCFCGSCGHIVE